GLGEVIMTADLNRSVTSVRHCQRDSGSVLVQDNVARYGKNLSWYHVSPQSKRFRPTLQVHPLRVRRGSRSFVRPKGQARSPSHEGKRWQEKNPPHTE